MTAVDAVLSVEDLVVDYRHRKGWFNAVNGVSFAIQPGEVLGLAGESGCGKSTVAAALLGDRRPGSRIRGGRVMFDRRNLVDLSESELQPIRGVRIGFVPQNPATSLTPSMTIGRQVRETLHVHGIGGGDVGRRAHDLLAGVGLPEPEATARKYPHQLSGGQQQRVVIAMALAHEPALIVLDEPTTGLDVTTQKRILDLLADIRARSGSAMLYVSHDLGALSQICDRIAVMYAGELIELAAVDRLFSSPHHPYTRGLIASVPRLDHMPDRNQMLRGLLHRDNLPGGCRFAPRCDFARATCHDSAQQLELIGPEHTAACMRWRELATPPAALSA